MQLTYCQLPFSRTKTKAILCVFYFLTAPLFITKGEEIVLPKEKDRAVKAYQERIRSLEQELARAQFTKVVMEDNLRSISLSPPKAKTDFIVWYLVFSHLLFIGGFVFLVKRQKKKSGPQKKVKSNPIEEEWEDSMQLTEREVEVLTLLVNKKSNPEISKSLFISRNTTKTHVANILKKLEVSNRQEAAEKAKALQLIPTPTGTRKDSISLGKLGGFFVLFGIGSHAQTTIDNQTSCAYLVKVNLLEEGSCQLQGNGPLVKIEPHRQIKLPPIPSGSWIVGYGVEEVEGSIEQAVLAGNPLCNFRRVVKPYGSCRTTLQYQENGLLLVEE